MADGNSADSPPVLTMNEPLLQPAAQPKCTRCDGRMMLDPVEGDAACFTCGNVVYGTPPLPVGEPVRREARRVYHAGVDIS
jgi:hypothetical protein